MNGKEYERQLDQMLANAKQWRAEHPEAKVLIQFNFPPGVCVIAPISEAVKHNFVSTNADGLLLLKALWRWDVASEPTVMMCRVVLEAEPT